MASILAASREEASLAVRTVISLLQSLGFAISTEKSVEEPSQSMGFYQWVNLLG
jgi:hypothetical protein